MTWLESAVGIRAASVADAEALARLWIETGEHLASLDPDVFQVPEVDGLHEFFAELLGRAANTDRSWLVAVVDGELVGQVQAHVETPVESAAFQVHRHLAETRLLVDTLAVTAGARRRGVGRALMSAVQAWGAARGATHVTLDTFARSPLSLPFYERLGFSRTAILLQKRI